MDSRITAHWSRPSEWHENTKCARLMRDVSIGLAQNQLPENTLDCAFRIAIGKDDVLLNAAACGQRYT